MDEHPRLQGIIFDMDNTLLRSSIDFPGMKRALFQFLVACGAVGADLAFSELSVSQLVELARRWPGFSPALEQPMWELVARYETEGMRGAGLEAGVEELLGYCHGRYRLAVLTNNAHRAACVALAETGIDRYFAHIVGREQMGALKPSPAGVLHILGLCPELPAAAWVMVGDSWIDGKAAQDAGVAFIAYRSRGEELARRGVTPGRVVAGMSELLGWLQGHRE